MSCDHDLLKVEMSLSPTTYLSLSSTSITHAPPSKDVGRKRSSTPLKQHGCWCHLPLPSPSALPRHLMSSVENASPSLLTPSFATSLDVECQGCLPGLPLPLHPPLCHVTRCRASRMPPVPQCNALAPSA